MCLSRKYTNFEFKFIWWALWQNNVSLSLSLEANVFSDPHQSYGRSTTADCLASWLTHKLTCNCAITFIQWDKEGNRQKIKKKEKKKEATGAGVQFGQLWKLTSLQFNPSPKSINYIHGLHTSVRPFADKWPTVRVGPFISMLTTFRQFSHLSQVH